MPGLKKIVWLITTFFILTGIFLGVLLSERRPQLPQLVRTQQQKQKQHQIKKNGKKNM